MNKIVIIDDGICGNALLNVYQLSSYLALETGKIVCCPQESNFYTHGTICAKIIEEFCPLEHIVSIKVLSKNGKGTIKRLLGALEWCIEKHINLIHMSIGTQNYHDIQLMDKYIKLLVNNGCIIVAAQGNNNVITYPASYPGVFGVRRDTNNILIEGQYTLLKNNGLKLENSIVAKYKSFISVGSYEAFSLEEANSYVAPMITGLIKRYKILNSSATIKDIFNYLHSNMTIVDNMKINPLKKYNPARPPIEKPFCLATVDSNDLSLELYNELKSREYSIEIITEFKNQDYAIIPLGYYCSNPSAFNQNMLSYLYSIYKVDILIFSFHASSISLCKLNRLMDATIITMEDGILFYGENEKLIFNNSAELIQELTECGEKL